MARDSHQKAAELHHRTAHAHLAATQHGKQDYETGHEQSRQALERSARIFSESAESSSEIRNPHRQNKWYRGGD